VITSLPKSPVPVLPGQGRSWRPVGTFSSYAPKPLVLQDCYTALQELDPKGRRALGGCNTGILCDRCRHQERRNIIIRAPAQRA